MAFEINLTSEGSQRFKTTIDGVSYEFKVSYNRRMSAWTCSIFKAGSPLVSGIALVGGVDIVKQFPIEIRNLFAVNISEPTKDATDSNLGTDVLLVKLSDTEVEQIG